ncbi:MAG: calcium-binding protein [Leptolyngbyaceae cyanobacterium MO_188.B28]|nr:calcium-binding protein [Leptolyngbyaceae cyanobacterium MO_188.B28]
MKKKASLKVGDSVIVKPDVKDPDFGQDIGGWQGRISELDQSNNLVCIDLDSITLKNIPSHYIDECEEAGLVWDKIYLWITDVELTSPRDSEREVAAVTKQLSVQHAWSHLGAEGKRIQAVLTGVDPDDTLGCLEAWLTHFEKVFRFPFEAEVVELLGRSPLRVGDRIIVKSLLDETDGLSGVLANVKKGRRSLIFQLCDLEATDIHSANYGYLRDYVVWFANR